MLTNVVIGHEPWKCTECGVFRREIDRVEQVDVIIGHGELDSKTGNKSRQLPDAVCSGETDGFFDEESLEKFSTACWEFCKEGLYRPLSRRIPADFRFSSAY